MNVAKGIRVHGVLFAVVVLWAFQTWSRDAVRDEEGSRILVWEHDTTDVVAVRYRGPGKALEIQRRTDVAGAFLWGTEITSVESDGAGLAPSVGDVTGSDPPSQGAVEPPATPDTLAFPVGAPGHTLVARLAVMSVIRDLGPLSPEQKARFGLAEPAERIQVEFRDGHRELLLGDTAYGGSDRYAADSSSGKGYVVSSDVTRPLSIGEGALRERWLHHFSDAQVSRVRVEAGGGERIMARTAEGEWTADGGAAGQGSPDAAFANFMQRVDQLAIAGYGASPPLAGIRLLLRVDYMAEDGDPLGFVELVRVDGAERDPYYVRSERTRTMARAVTALAERVEEGMGDIFMAQRDSE